MTLARLFSVISAFFILVVLCACPPREPLGYKPPPVDDPVKAFENNWDKFKLTSGQYKLTFRYSDGQRVSLRADMVVDPDERCRVDLSSDRGLEAYIILNSTIINLINWRERYYVREDNTPENSGRLVGLYLPANEVTALLGGRGIKPKRFSQVYREPVEGGGIRLLAFHESEGIRMSALLDNSGRLLSARYVEADTEEPLVEVQYSGFRLHGATGLVWPTRFVIDLMKTGDRITFRARDVDINPARDDLDFVFAPRRPGRGKQLRLEDVPPGGPPLLYSSVKEYVK